MKSAQWHIEEAERLLDVAWSMEGSADRRMARATAHAQVARAIVAVRGDWNARPPLRNTICP